MRQQVEISICLVHLIKAWQNETMNVKIKESKGNVHNLETKSISYQ